MKKYHLFIFILLGFGCSKKQDITPPPPPGSFYISSLKVNDQPASNGNNFYSVNINPVIKISFTAPVDHASVNNNFSLAKNTGVTTPLNISYQNMDSTLIIQTTANLQSISKYILTLTTGVQSKQGVVLHTNSINNLITAIDSSDKFPILTDNALLDKIQHQTFNYFWDFGHPVSGMAKERNSSGDLVTTGGTGFGIMAIVTAVNRNFITRADGTARILKMADFLINNCTRYHGAFAHWINGATGATIPFSNDDNGADLVETSYLMQGLITARQYFNTSDATETNLRNKINILWNGVDWHWFRQGSQNVLYWHWSQDKAWVINAPVKGWNEALITYVMASSSLTNAIPRIVYDNGWSSNGAMKNNNLYFGYQLPLGPNLGGPLFFEHYSFMGINPKGLSDAYANYDTQTINHTKINYKYCISNPHNYYGYSANCWGLTASDVPAPIYYNANEPNNDIGVITPSAALSSFPYTPAESMQALKFFYYKLGDKIWGQYGFIDAFKLSDPWFADSNLAIDQGPIIVMIENYRTGLLWNLFTGAPEIKVGMLNLGFKAPYL